MQTQTWQIADGVKSEVTSPDCIRLAGISLNLEPLRVFFFHFGSVLPHDSLHAAEPHHDPLSSVKHG